MRCAVSFHLHNLKNVKNTHRGLLLLVNPAALLKITLHHGSFSRFLNCTNSTKLSKTSLCTTSSKFALTRNRSPSNFALIINPLMYNVPK